MWDYLIFSNAVPSRISRKKTDEQAPETETPKTENSTEIVKEASKTDESAAKTTPTSDTSVAEKPAQTAETATDETKSDEVTSPAEPQTVKATEPTSEKPAEPATPADQDEQQTETVEAPETSTNQEPESQKSESQAPEPQQPVSAEPEEKQAETDSEQSTPAADKTETDNTETSNAESSDDEQPATTDAERYDKGLEKSRLTFGQRLNHLLANFRSVDENFFDDLEETLIGADVGYDMAMKISDELREEVKLKNVKKSKDVQNVVVKKIDRTLRSGWHQRK